MDLRENKDIINVIKLLGRGIKKHGLKKIISSLQKIDLVSINVHHLDVIDFIETSICERYKILRSQLYQENTRGDVTLVRRMCILLLRKHLALSDEEIGSHYNRTRQALRIAKSEFEKLNPQSRVDVKFINAYNEFDEKIKTYILEMTSKINNEISNAVETEPTEKTGEVTIEKPQSQTE